jgi:hypothetical protein
MKLELKSNPTSYPGYLSLASLVSGNPCSLNFLDLKSSKSRVGGYPIFSQDFKTVHREPLPYSYFPFLKGLDYETRAQDEFT